MNGNYNRIKQMTLKNMEREISISNTQFQMMAKHKLR